MEARAMRVHWILTGSRGAALPRGMCNALASSLLAWPYRRRRAAPRRAFKCPQKEPAEGDQKRQISSGASPLDPADF